MQQMRRNKNMAKAELATVEDFKIVTGMEAMDEELRAELEDEMDDLDDDGGIDAKHIKILRGRDRRSG